MKLRIYDLKENDTIETLLDRRRSEFMLAFGCITSSLLVYWQLGFINMFALITTEIIFTLIFIERLFFGQSIKEIIKEKY